MEEEIKERLIDRFTGPELVELLDIPMSELVELLFSPYIEDQWDEIQEELDLDRIQ